MFYGKTLKRDLEELRKKVENKDREIERLRERLDSLSNQVDKLSDRVATLSRIMHNHVDGEITYKNVSSPYRLSNFSLAYVYIYKDKQEYKFDGINLINPMFKALGENLLNVTSNGTSYIFDLSSENAIKILTKGDN